MKAEVFLPDDYRPAEDEPFMNVRQLEYFRRKLLTWKAEILSDSRDTIEGMKDSTRNIPDIADRASEETDRALEVVERARRRVDGFRSHVGRIYPGMSTDPHVPDEHSVAGTALAQAAR